MSRLTISSLEIKNFYPPSSFPAYSSSNHKPLTSFAFNKQSLLRREISFNSIDAQTKNDINEINKIFETTQKNKFSNSIKQDQLELIKNKLRSLEPKKLSQLITSATLSGNDFAEHLKIMNQLRDNAIAGIFQPIIINPQPTPSINSTKEISLDDLVNILKGSCQSLNEVELYNFFNKTLFESNKDVQLIFNNSSIAKVNLEDFKNSIAEIELKLTEQIKNKSSILSDIEKSKINDEILQLQKISKALSGNKDDCIAFVEDNEQQVIGIPIFTVVVIAFFCLFLKDRIRRMVSRQQANSQEDNLAPTIPADIPVEANPAPAIPADIPVGASQGRAIRAEDIPVGIPVGTSQREATAERHEISRQQEIEMITREFQRSARNQNSLGNPQEAPLSERLERVRAIMMESSQARAINGVATWYGTSLGNSRSSARLQGNPDLQRHASQPRGNNRDRVKN